VGRGDKEGPSFDFFRPTSLQPSHCPRTPRENQSALPIQQCTQQARRKAGWRGGGRGRGGTAVSQPAVGAHESRTNHNYPLLSQQVSSKNSMRVGRNYPPTPKHAILPHPAPFAQPRSLQGTAHSRVKTQDHHHHRQHTHSNSSGKGEHVSSKSVEGANSPTIAPPCSPLPTTISHNPALSKE